MSTLTLFTARLTAARSLTEQVRILQEVLAYVMQTGPKGGKFYYTPQGKKIYRTLGGKTLKRKKFPRATSEEEFKHEWMQASQVRGDIKLDARALDAMTHVFGDKLPLPETFHAMFSSPGLSMEEAKIVTGPTGRGFTISFQLKDSDGVRIGDVERVFSRGMQQTTPRVEHEFFALLDQYQGGGRAGALLGNSLKGYQALGVGEIKVYASLEAGPYTWAKFGFQPEDMDWMRNECSALFEKYGIPEAQVAKLLKRVKSIQDLASLTYKTEVPDESGKMVPTTIPIGKLYLLHGGSEGFSRSWEGTFDVKDPKAVRRWNAQCRKGEKTRNEEIAAGRGNAPVPPHVLAARQGKYDRLVSMHNEHDSLNLKDLASASAKTETQA